MTRISLLLCLVLVSVVVSAQQRPNIIMFLVDDMGWQDTSLPFWKEETDLNRRYHTPNMERLAREGMKFTNAYATPVCTPTRTSFMTGMNAAHHHITNWTRIEKDVISDHDDSLLLIPKWNHDGLSPVKGIPNTAYATPLPQLLRDGGYFTIHVGKAHWGSAGTPGSNPYNMGFMVNVAGNAIGHPQSYLGEDNYGNIPGKASSHAVHDLSEYYGSETFLSEALTREAIKSLEAPIARKQPFFLNMAHYAVHTPLQADQRFYQKYLDAGLDEKEARYASMVEGMDKSLGDIMDYLKDKKAERNTIIIFMTDNGGLSLTPQRGGVQHTHNLPLRMGKGTVYEGGVRVPMIVKWPGVVKPGTTTAQYVIIEDFFPTLLEMGAIKNYKTVQSIDGKSFVPVLRNPSYRDSARFLVWHYPHKWLRNDSYGINFMSAIRQGDWKMVYHLKSGKRELFNLKEDIEEANDLAAKYPDKVKSLSSMLSNQLRKWDAPMPLLKSTGKAVPFSDEL